MVPGLFGFKFLGRERAVGILYCLMGWASLPSPSSFDVSDCNWCECVGWATVPLLTLSASGVLGSWLLF